MGNQMTTSLLSSDNATGKIVYWDGSVQEFDKPLTAAELMLEHPQQVVVEFHSAVNQKRPTPLTADEKLEMKKIYLMVPMKPGKPVGLSGEESRRIHLIVSSVVHSKSLLRSWKFVPWLARICHASTIGEGVLQKEEDDTVEKSITEEKCVFSETLLEILEGRPEFLNRQLSGKGSWKPSLDTIKEKKKQNKVPHWLFLKTF